MATDDIAALLGGGSYSAPIRTRTDIVERSSQAGQALLSADLPGAWRSLLAPDELTPKERDRFMRKYGLDRSPFSAVYRTLTNPAMIFALALSYKFPTPSAENIFKLSKRVSGMAARFPFLGKMTSAWTTFRGTDVPDALGDIMRNVDDFGGRYGMAMQKALTKYRETTGRLPTARENVMLASWLDGLHKRVHGFEQAGALMPGLERAMSPALKGLGTELRGTLNEMFAEVFENLPNRKAILKALMRQKQAGFDDADLAQLREWIKNPRKIADFFPHRVLKNEEEFRSLMKALVKGTDLKAASAARQKKILQWLGPEFYKRKGSMLPSTQDLAQVGDLVDQGVLSRVQSEVRDNLLKAAGKAGVREEVLDHLRRVPLKDLPEEFPKYMQSSEADKFAQVLADIPPREYSLKLAPVLHNYNHTMATTFAWTAKGGGERMMSSLNEAKALAAAGNPHAKLRAEMLENTLIPIAMGRQSFRQAVRGQIWDTEMAKLSLRMDNPTVRKVLGNTLSDYFKETLQQSKGAFSLLNLNRKAAGYFYMSTLGMNPASALKNLFQVVLTTGPTVGWKSTAIGAERAFKKAHTYYSSRFAKGLTHREALKSAYPEFVESGLAGAPLVDETLSNALQNAYNLAAAPAGKGVKTAERIGRAMMSMFSTSEHAVRLTTFEAAMYHAARTSMTNKAAQYQFARRVVEQTQFMTGVQNTPHFLLERSPLMRQFLQFPLRFLEFTTRTALTMGGGAIDPKTGKEMSVLGMNPGAFARLVAGSVIATELGDAVGINLGDALIGGALPTFTEAGKPFAPVPVLPPAAQLVGAVGLGVASGDFTELVRSTPLLIPGGIPLYRSMGLLPGNVPGSAMGQEAAKWAGRAYADYEQPAPDGRIAVYSGKGVLKGFFTPWQVASMGLGIKARSAQQEQELVHLITTNRDQIREYRRDYYDKLFTNDARGAMAVASEFKQRFGFDLPTSERDAKAMQMRRRTTRLEQVFQTLPPGEARARFGEIIQATMGADAQGLLGIDPVLLGQPRQQREAARSRNTGGRGPSPQSTVGPYLNQMGPTETVSPSELGRQPYPQVSRFGF